MAWVVGGTVYGHARALRSWLEDAGLHHVLAVPDPGRAGACGLGPLPALPAFRHGLEDWQAYVAFAPRAATRRRSWAWPAWAIEHAFGTVKQETGLDDHEVRSAHGWYRHVTLALWALALLAGRTRRRPGCGASWLGRTGAAVTSG
jgi:hypothetical protein